MARSSSGSGLINPDQFVCRAGDLNTDPVWQAAADLRGFGQNLSGRIDEICATWDTLSECYQAPQADLILDMMDPAQADAHQTADIFEQIAGRLEYFAHDLESIKPRLADFEERAWEFRRRVQNGVEVESYHQNGWVGWATGVSVVQWKLDKQGVDATRTIPWNEHRPSVEENADLLAEYARLLEQISQSATDAANAVHATHQVVSACTPVPESPRYGALTADLIMAGEMPWGEPVSEDRNCAEQVSSGVGDFGYDTFFGITSLFGYHPDTGLSATTLGQTWGGLGNVLGSMVVTLIAGSPDRFALDADSATGRWLAERRTVSGGAVTGLVGYDLGSHQAGGDGWHAWRGEPWRAGSSSVLNIASFFVPATAAVKGASVAGRAGRVAAGAARWGASAAELLFAGGSWFVRGGVRMVRGADDLFSVRAVPVAGAVRRGADELRASRTPDDSGVRFGVDRPRFDDSAGGGKAGGGPESLLHGDAAPRVHEPSHVERVEGQQVGEGSGGAAPEVRPEGSGQAPGGDGGAVHPIDPEYQATMGGQQVGDVGFLEVLDDVLGQHGLTLERFDELVNTSVLDLTRAEVDMLVSIRDAMPPIDARTVLQKVITPQQVLAVLKDQLEFLVDPETWARWKELGPKELEAISGFVSRVSDVFGSSAGELFDVLGMNYPRTVFVRGEEMFSVRFEAGRLDVAPGGTSGVLETMQRLPDDLYDMPPGPARDGAIKSWLEEQLGPDGARDIERAVDRDNAFRGNGFSGNEQGYGPEYTLGGNKNKIPKGAEMWQTMPDGKERPVAMFNGEEWVPLPT